MKKNSAMNMLKQSILSTVLALISFTARADSCSDLNALWAQKYHADFHVEWPLSSFDCTSYEGRFAEAIHSLNTSTFYPGTDGTVPDFYKWVTGIITKTVYQPKNAVLDYAAASSSGGILWLHDAYFTQSREWRTGVLVHEARHSDIGDPRHVVCWHGDAVNNLSCDQTFMNGENQGSGYNYEFHYYWWIRDGAAKTDLSRGLAEAQMRHLLLNRFNEVRNEQVQKFVR